MEQSIVISDARGAAFDYSALDAETRIVLQQRAREAREDVRRLAGLVRQTAETVWTLGDRLADAQDRLAHRGSGSFLTWCRAELPEVSQRTLYNALNVRRSFPEFATVANSSFDIPMQALYLLASPSTPDAAREEILRRAEAGERVRHRDVKEIVHAAKAEVAPPAPPRSAPARGAIERPSDQEQAELKHLVRAVGGSWFGLVSWGEAGPLYRIAFLRERAENYTAAQIRARTKPTPPPDPAPPAPEILDGVGRQPYGAKGADRWQPNVPHVLIIGDREGRYAPPLLIRAATIYDTPTTVRVRRPDGKEETQTQHKVWAVPDDAAWAAIEAATAAFGAALASFADVLRELGRYDKRLAENGGIKQIPTGPLCPSVARADDPDASNQSAWWLSPWHVPYLERKSITRHTAKMLTAGGENAYFFAQSDSWLLADDAAWERVSAAQQACKDAAAAAEQLLGRLGTYDEALDGRHQRKPTQALSAAELAALATMSFGPPYWHPRPYADKPGLVAMVDGNAPRQLVLKTLEEWRTIAAERASIVPAEDKEALDEAGDDEDEDEEAPPIDVTGAFAKVRAAAAAQEQADLGGAEDVASEDLDAQMLAAVGAILGGLPEPAVRILAAHLCFGDVSDVAFTAPLEEIYDGFAEVASQGSGDVMPAAWRAGARAALAALGLAGVPQKAAAD